jgi:hypothetical protein
MMSNIHNDEIMERLYDEAYEELSIKYEFELVMPRDEYALHCAAVELAQKRWENDYA